MNNIMEFYTKLLSYGGMSADNEGFIKADGNLQVLVKGKSLVLPTREHLSTLTEKDDKGNIVPVKVVFHPLKESAIKSEGAVLTKLRTSIAARLNYSLLIVIQHMLLLASNNDGQTKVRGKSMKFLASLGEVATDTKTAAVDEKTIKIFQKLFETGADNNFYKNLVAVYVKKGGYVGQERYNRITVIDYPLYNEICNTNNRVVRGVKLRVKDVALFKALFQFIIPDIDMPGSGQYGSNNTVSPGVVSLLDGTSSVADIINDLSNVFKVPKKEYATVRFDTDFIEEIGSLNSLVGEINAIPVEESGRTIVPGKTDTPALEDVVEEPNPVKTGHGIDPRSLNLGIPRALEQLSNRPIPFSPPYVNETNNFGNYNNYQHMNQYPNNQNTAPPPWDHSPMNSGHPQQHMYQPPQMTPNYGPGPQEHGINLNAIKKV